MSRSPSMNQPSPPQARADSSACQVSPARPQPRSVSFEPGKAVEHGVEVGRDVEAEHLEVVADVADDRQLTRRENVVEPGRELCAADAARQSRTTFTRARPSDLVLIQHKVRAAAGREGQGREVRDACRRRARARGCATGSSAGCGEAGGAARRRRWVRTSRLRHGQAPSAFVVPSCRGHVRRSAGREARERRRSSTHGTSALTTRQTPATPASAASTAAPWPPPGSSTTSAPRAAASAAAAASSVTRRTRSPNAIAASSTSPSIASATSTRISAGSLLLPPERKGTIDRCHRPEPTRGPAGQTVLRRRGSRRQAPRWPTRAPRTSACPRAPRRPGGRCGRR